MKLYALLNCINDYEDRDHIRPLVYAIADGRRVDRFLHGCGFEIHALFDAEATLSRINAKLKEITAKLEPGDVFFYYFSGHGYERGQGEDRRQFLLPRDVGLWALEHGGAGALSASFVEECTRIPGVKRALVFDACRGALSRHKGFGWQAASYSSKDIDQVGRQGGTIAPVVIVCSCHPDQLAYEESTIGAGIFTGAMIDVFQAQRDIGGEIGFTPELNVRITDRVRQILATTSIPETHHPIPYVSGNPAGVVLVPGAGPVRQKVQVIVPTLRITTEPTAAQIEVDGIACGRTPVEIALEGGRHNVKATLAGYEICEKWIQLDGKDDAELAFRLIPDPTTIAAAEVNLQEMRRLVEEREAAERAKQEREQHAADEATRRQQEKHISKMKKDLAISIAKHQWLDARNACDQLLALEPGDVELTETREFIEQRLPIAETREELARRAQEDEIQRDSLARKTQERKSNAKAGFLGCLIVAPMAGAMVAAVVRIVICLFAGSTLQELLAMAWRGAVEGAEAFTVVALVLGTIIYIIQRREPFK